MSNSPLIRTAVNLCLIAAIVIQPMTLVAAQGTCAQGQCCEAKTVCHACKCCEVKTDGALCGCCSGNEEDAGSCCTNKREQSKHDDLFGEISDVVPEPPKPDDEDLVQDRVALSSCMCGIRSEPIAPAPHRVPVPQVRELVVIAYLDHVASDAGLSIRPDQLVSRLPLGDHSPHFSQRFLCIWRI
ncbi:hypothetical protein K227x_35550 [Rubripirellula lacrimiformis]|uniref:Uncharacterized protein n=1 Tax=Rubripirellula lacrimiformis TaxID=1930273 RepID=A0A517NDG9_9BACT|nr:hypothetical protein [Rubripirellula lacrimiformis]QDT05156.1 hypothetical protein K227x_35550 [Rubripirellula lacrimiformis]